MSTRRTILRELTRRHANGNGDYTRPATIAGYDEQPAAYQAAVNALLQERLINGRKDEEGRIAIALNTQRLADVQKELRPWFTRPAVWSALLAMGAAAAVIIAILQ